MKEVFSRSFELNNGVKIRDGKYQWYQRYTNYLEKIDPKTITNIDRGVFKDAYTLVDRLTMRSVEGEYDVVYLSSHGRPKKLRIGNSFVTTNDLLEIPGELREEIQSGISATGHCRSDACYIMLNTIKPKYRSKYLTDLPAHIRHKQREYTYDRSPGMGQVL